MGSERFGRGEVRVYEKCEEHRDLQSEGESPAYLVAEEAAESSAGCASAAIEEIDVGLVCSPDFYTDQVVDHDAS